MKLFAFVVFLFALIYLTRLAMYGLRDCILESRHPICYVVGIITVVILLSILETAVVCGIIYGISKLVMFIFVITAR